MVKKLGPSKLNGKSVSNPQDSSPMTKLYERERMIQLVDEIAEELWEKDRVWMSVLGIEIVEDEGWFELRCDNELLLIEAGPDSTILVNGLVDRPEHLFFTQDYYQRIKAVILKWAAGEQ